MTDQGVFELLRNVAEHWDEVGGRSANKLASTYPTVSPRVTDYPNKRDLGGQCAALRASEPGWLESGNPWRRH